MKMLVLAALLQPAMFGSDAKQAEFVPPLVRVVPVNSAPSGSDKDESGGRSDECIVYSLAQLARLPHEKQLALWEKVQTNSKFLVTGYTPWMSRQIARAMGYDPHRVLQVLDSMARALTKKRVTKIAEAYYLKLLREAKETDEQVADQQIVLRKSGSLDDAFKLRNLLDKSVGLHNQISMIRIFSKDFAEGRIKLNNYGCVR